MRELVAFLLARIAEDRTALLQISEYFELGARWVAECDARQRIVELVAQGAQHPDSLDGCEVLRVLAQPYSEHPDYRDDWRLGPTG